jgi:hypothetical protein
MDVNAACPICEQPADYFGAARDGSRVFEVDCQRCSRYKISLEALEVLPANKYLLSYVCRTWSETESPKILTTNLGALIARAPLRSIPDKRDWLIEILANKTEAPGHLSKFDAAKDYPLVTARDAGEAAWLMKSLVAAGQVLAHGNTQGALTMVGWERIGQLRQAGPNSALAFVAMSFAEVLNELFDKAIGPAVSQAGFDPVRVDRREHTNSIDDEIVGNIRKSRFMVADFTGQRAGVYFEAGLMAGLGRTVIWMCDKNELAKVHFDVRQRNFIGWASIEDARQRLYNRIMAIEGEGPNAAIPNR